MIFDEGYYLYSMKKITIVFLWSIFNLSFLQAQKIFTHADSLRGSNGEGRKKWDVLFYDILVEPNIQKQNISGNIKIDFIDHGADKIQLDLQKPMKISIVLIENKRCSFSRSGNVYWVKLPKLKSKSTSKKTLNIQFYGTPKKAVRAPWDGGWVWEKDSLGNPFIGIACQGLGSSVWFPCKDIQSDEPDSGCNIRIVVPDSLVAVSNGKLVLNLHDKLKKTRTFQWKTTSTINNYNIISYIGNYTCIQDSFHGSFGKLSLSYWILKQHESSARIHFSQTKKMLEAFEHYFGPYPFYRDGYKLVEAPYLGMEHQSAIAYGNYFQNGYLGLDRSKTGWGLDWDFIIVHESGHEWFGNSLTSRDMAENWIHESFTTYSEALYIEYFKGKNAATEYIVGLRPEIENKEPMIMYLGVNHDPTGDIYNKGANVIHTLRQWINNDSLFFQGLKNMLEKYKHSIVTSKQIEQYWIEFTGLKLDVFFDQYLRTSQIPELWVNKENDGFLRIEWKNTLPGFEMPVDLIIDGTSSIRVFPTNQVSKIKTDYSLKKVSIKVHPSYYVLCQEALN
jgi:aminopeptidase N